MLVFAKRRPFCNPGFLLSWCRIAGSVHSGPKNDPNSEAYRVVRAMEGALSEATEHTDMATKRANAADKLVKILDLEIADKMEQADTATKRANAADELVKILDLEIAELKATLTRKTG